MRGCSPECATRRSLLSIALRLGADGVCGWSDAERELTKQMQLPVSRAELTAVRDEIRAGGDPLGERYLAARPIEERRQLGAVYTPSTIVQAMLAWATHQPTPARIVDPGAGSARFLCRAALAFPQARLIGIEIDPLAAIIARANLAASGLASRSSIRLQDYREADLRSPERTLFMGNPPYVRHHRIEPRWKDWLARRARELHLGASGLAGLHAHFFLATVLNSRKGDFGALITSAEWLDVNYGRLLRELFLGGLGGQGIILVEPTAAAFPDTATTAAVTFFRIASKPRCVRLRRVRRLEDLQELRGGEIVERGQLRRVQRWSRLTTRARSSRGGADVMVELGELCRVHRGQVTGANRIWIAGEHAKGLPTHVLLPTITRARELIRAGKLLNDASHLRRVVDLPEHLDELDSDDRAAVHRFLGFARRSGAHASYVARHRRAWWSVGLRQPAPILATYMARRPPAFTRNLAGARHINIAHGLYPREPLSETQLCALVDYLSGSVDVAEGRTYAGGLTKFEPREMERLLVPSPAADQCLGNSNRSNRSPMAGELVGT